MSADTIPPRYRVIIDARHPETHRLSIQIKPLAGHELPHVLTFPVWSPGSYMIREYSRHVTRMQNAKKIAKNIWEPLALTKPVDFEVYCFERTVRTSYLDDKIMILVGSTLLPLLHGPFIVELLLPRTWKTLGTALPTKRKAAGKWELECAGDDEWIDAPIVAGAPGSVGAAEFLVGRIPHRIVWVGSEPAIPMTKLIQDFRKIFTSTIQLFGGAPFRRYEVLLDFCPKMYGGLEHRASQLSVFDPWDLADPKRYEQFLGLIAHEYFHSWNVKSIRPEALGPFRYGEENYTEELWFAEGLTSFFDDLLVMRAGLMTKESLARAFLKNATNLREGAPGIIRRSLAESSFDAWIRYYRPDEDSLNTDVSYYIKGALLGWCWEAELQKRSRGRWTLSRLFREIYKEFGISATEPLRLAKPGFRREELLDFCSEKTGVSHAFVEEWVTSRKRLPWREAAKVFGFEFKARVVSHSLHQFGLNLVEREGKLFVGNVVDGSSSNRAGIAANDEILAINNQRTPTAESFQTTVLRHLQKSRGLELVIARAGVLGRAKILPEPNHDLGIEWELVRLLPKAKGKL